MDLHNSWAPVALTAATSSGSPRSTRQPWGPWSNAWPRSTTSPAGGSGACLGGTRLPESSSSSTGWVRKNWKGVKKGRLRQALRSFLHVHQHYSGERNVPADRIRINFLHVLHDSYKENSLQLRWIRWSCGTPWRPTVSKSARPDTKEPLEPFRMTLVDVLSKLLSSCRAFVQWSLLETWFFFTPSLSLSIDSATSLGLLDPLRLHAGPVKAMIWHSEICWRHSTSIHTASCDIEMLTTFFPPQRVIDYEGSWHWQLLQWLSLFF